MNTPKLNESYKHPITGRWTRLPECVTFPCNAQDAIDTAERLREDMLHMPLTDQQRKDLGLACRILDAWFDMHRKAAGI